MLTYKQIKNNTIKTVLDYHSKNYVSIKMLYVYLYHWKNTVGEKYNGYWDFLVNDKDYEPTITEFEELPEKLKLFYLEWEN